MGRIFTIVLAVLLHLAFILFGGWFLHKDEPAKKKTTVVELTGDDAPSKAKEKEKEKEKVEPTEKKDEVEATEEKAPDAADVIEKLEPSAAAAAPALDASSLAALSDALNGTGAAGGDFTESVSFASGGRIGGTGKAGVAESKLDDAFSLTEIDQKPRASYQAAPNYPGEMRGKKVAGVVTVLFIVDASGKVQSPKVERATHPAFEKPALEAVRQWKFEPAVKGGKRVACSMRVPIKFQPS